jgi:hypothetical protein
MPIQHWQPIRLEVSSCYYPLIREVNVGGLQGANPDLVQRSQITVVLHNEGNGMFIGKTLMLIILGWVLLSAGLQGQAGEQELCAPFLHGKVDSSRVETMRAAAKGGHHGTEGDVLTRLLQKSDLQTQEYSAILGQNMHEDYVSGSHQQ